MRRHVLRAIAANPFNGIERNFCIVHACRLLDLGIHSMELKGGFGAGIAQHQLVLNPFNGIERRYLWALGGAAIGAVVNPFNGIERLGLRWPLFCLEARIHSMELKGHPMAHMNAMIA